MKKIRPVHITFMHNLQVNMLVKILALQKAYKLILVTLAAALLDIFI